jgi:hypothetical protein
VTSLRTLVSGRNPKTKRAWLPWWTVGLRRKEAFQKRASSNLAAEMASPLDGRMFRAAIYSLLAATVTAYSVPSEIGTPSPSPIKSPTTKPQTLADVAADVASLNR